MASANAVQAASNRLIKWLGIIWSGWVLSWSSHPQPAWQELPNQSSMQARAVQHCLNWCGPLFINVKSRCRCELVLYAAQAVSEGYCHSVAGPMCRSPPGGQAQAKPFYTECWWKVLIVSETGPLAGCFLIGAWKATKQGKLDCCHASRPLPSLMLL